MHETVEQKDINGMTLHVIPTKKFKTIQIVLKFRAPLNEETITKRALLPYLLRKGTERYTSEKQLQMALDQLYGATLSIDGAKKGNNHILSVRLEIANEKYITHATEVISEAVSLLNEVVYRPLVDNDGFDEAIFSREKKTLRNKIEAIVDDKMTYANLRLIDEMCAEETYRVHVYGYKKQLETLDRSELYSYYKDMINTDQCDLYIVGDVSSAEMASKIREILPTKRSTSSHAWVENEHKADVKVNEVIEHQDIQQAKLHIGYRTNCTYQDDEYFALQVFNGLFGGFPNSKLFINVREKHSLAYYAASRIESLKGLMIVVSGIDGDDYTKARSIIDEQLEAMKNAEFTEEMMNETKEMIRNQFLESLDNPQGMVEMNYQQLLGDSHWTLDSFIENIQQVTKEDVVEVAKKIEQDTVYLLTKQGGDSHE